MSSLPTNLMGSVFQTPLAQRQISVLRDAERSQNATAQRQQVVAVDEKDSTVETTDNDTQVHTDSEGQGGQGRESTNPEEEAPAPPEARASDNSEEGRLIDLEA
jgi:hypothetical protein